MAASKPKVIRRSLVDQVYHLILERIRNGELKPGDRLNIESLSDEFGVSRTPMREAISRLVQNGFVEMKHNVGPSITSLNVETVRELATANTVLLEGMMDLLFQEDSHDFTALCAELQEIIRLQKTALDAGDTAGFTRLSIAFHETLIHACPNDTLQSFALNTQVKLDLFVSSYQESDEMRRKSVADHTEILRCLSAGDQVGFRSALHEHNTSPIRFFEELQLKD